MEIKKEGTINLIAIFVVVVFTVMSCFACFETHFISTIVIGEYGESESLNAETITETTKNGITNNIVPIVVLSFLQIVFLILKERIMSITSVICAGLSIVVTVRELLKTLVESAFDSMGGLGTSEFKITVIGYIVLFLSVLNFVIQIISSRKKEGNEQ